MCCYELSHAGVPAVFLPAITRASKLLNMLSCPQCSKPGPRLAGVIFVSAPVFGRPDAAKEHRVTFAVAGPVETKEQLQPLLKAMSRGILDLGEEPQLANVMKITGDGSPAEALDNNASAGELGSGVER